MESITVSARWLIALVSLATCACTSLPSNPEAGVEKQIKACLPAAITMREGLRRSNVWSEVLVVSWNDGTPRGHAYCIYLYPQGQNQLWAYDRDWGSTRIRAYKDDANSVAQHAQRSRAIYSPVLSAEYLR